MYEFSVNKKDYINYYLFQNTAANKAYKRNLILSTLFIGFVTLGLSFLNGDTTQKNYIPAAIVLDLLLMIIAYFFLRYFDKKRLLNFALKSYEGLKEQDIQINFTPASINLTVKDSSSFSKSEIKYGEIIQIAETKNYLFICFKSPKVIIIPKKIKEIEVIKNELLEKTTPHDLKFVTKQNWVWK